MLKKYCSVNQCLSTAGKRTQAVSLRVSTGPKRFEYESALLKLFRKLIPLMKTFYLTGSLYIMCARGTNTMFIYEFKICRYLLTLKIRDRELRIFTGPKYVWLRNTTLHYNTRTRAHTHTVAFKPVAK
jgi:hypothetical protein